MLHSLGKKTKKKQKKVRFKKLIIKLNEFENEKAHV